MGCEASFLGPSLPVHLRLQEMGISFPSPVCLSLNLKLGSHLLYRVPTFQVTSFWVTCLEALCLCESTHVAEVGQRSTSDGVPQLLSTFSTFIWGGI